MIVKKNYIYIAVLYLVSLGYYLFSSIESFIISVIFVPTACLFLYISARMRNISLCIFVFLFSISHAINPSVFYLNRTEYDGYGWNSVGNFDFTLSDFFGIYMHVYGLMLLIILFSLLFYCLFRVKTNKIHFTNLFNNKCLSKKALWISSALIASFIVILIPVNIYMLLRKIGITGVEPPVLPFHLVGILFYFRSYLAPMLMFYLYMKSSRSIVLYFLILIYAVISGLCGASKSTLIVGAFPALFFAVADNRKIRMIAASLVLILVVPAISIWRNVIYYVDIRNVLNTISGLDISAIYSMTSIDRYLRSMTDVLYGTQAVVLAHQYSIENPLKAIIDFFSTHPIFENMALELYGLDLADTSFGVAIGLIASVILLAHKSVVLLIFLGFVVSVFLFACETIIKPYVSKNNNLSILAVLLCFFMVVNLYSGDLGKFYILMACSAVLLFLSDLLIAKSSNIRIKFRQSG